MGYIVIDELIAAQEGSEKLDQLIQQTLPEEAPVRQWTRDFEAARFLVPKVTGKDLIIMDRGTVEFAAESDFGERERFSVIAPPDPTNPTAHHGPDMALKVVRAAFIHLLAMEETERLDRAEHEIVP